jgi:hypothetical protein
MTTPVSGGCHCGALHVRFTPSGPLSSLAVRSCACSFCTKHGARMTTDPAGQLEIEVRDPSRLVRYRFAMSTADFLVCSGCGMYVAAVLTEGERSWATLNVNLIDPPADDRFTAATSGDYAAEDRQARIARRKARWTPTVVRLVSARRAELTEPSKMSTRLLP